MVIVDGSSSFLRIIVLDAFTDDPVAILFLIWLDFLEAGRKVVRFFFVDLDRCGNNETPGSGML